MLFELLATFCLIITAITVLRIVFPSMRDD